MIVITRRYTFDAAHRIEGHPKCGRLHGHSYGVEVCLSANAPSPETGMVRDYGDLDAIVKPILDGELDHRYLASVDNLKAGDLYAVIAAQQGHLAKFSFPVLFSTAEHLAGYLASRLVNDLRSQHAVDILRVSVSLQETPKSTAFVSVDVWPFSSENENLKESE